MAQTPELKAGQTAVPMDNLDRIWIKQGLQSLRQQLIRKRSTEQPGSAIHELRGKEISNLDTLIQRFA